MKNNQVAVDCIRLGILRNFPLNLVILRWKMLRRFQQAERFLLSILYRARHEGRFQNIGIRVVGKISLLVLSMHQRNFDHNCWSIQVRHLNAVLSVIIAIFDD